MSQHRQPAAASSHPAFDPVPLRARRDGWTPERQRGFICALAAGRDAGAAARAVGMSRESAYRLRRRPSAADFAAAWDAALAARAVPPRAHTAASSLLWHRAFYGSLKPVMRNGKQVGTLIRPDNRALLTLFDRFDRLARSADRHERSQ